MRVAICQAPEYSNISITCRLREGILANGDTIEHEYTDDFRPETWELPRPKAEINVFVGKVPQAVAEQFADTPTVFIGHGYTPETIYKTLSLKFPDPAGYLGKLGMPDDRRIKLGWEPKPWRRHDPNSRVVLKYGVNDGDMLLQIRKYTTRAVHIPITRIQSSFKAAHCVVTHDNEIALAAFLEGIPTLALHNCITRSVSSTTLEYIEYPYLAHREQRMAWLNDLAHTQWSVDEIKSGEAWQSIREQHDRLSQIDKTETDRGV